MATLRARLLLLLAVAFLGVAPSAARDLLQRGSPGSPPNGVETPGSQPAGDRRDARDAGTDTSPVLGLALATPDDISQAPVEEAYRFRDDGLLEDVVDMGAILDDSMEDEHVCRNSVVVAIGSIAVAIFVLYPIILCVLVCCARKIARMYREEEEEKAYACSLA